MTENLGQTIESAVDRATKEASTSGQEPTPSAADRSADSPDAARLPASSASDPGSGSDSSQPRTEGSPTTQDASDDEILRESGWLTLDARRTILKNARDKASATEPKIDALN